MNIEPFLGTIKKILCNFNPITLEQMDKVKLMERVDTKYLIPLCLLSTILEDCREDYEVMVVNQERICDYATQYYDTPHSFELYHQHHAGRLNRYKIRSRNYVTSQLQFFEVKYKNNKGRTNKKRIRTNTYDQPTIASKERDFLTTCSPLDANQFTGVLWVYYRRITLVNKYSLERLTLDLALQFEGNQQSKHFPKMVIAEVKQEKMSSSPFTRLMQKLHIEKGAISKYCFGIISIYQEVKYNSFKPHLLKVSKIIQQHDAFTGVN